MKRLIECVPNFSEGRDTAKVDAIVAAMREVPGVYLLDRESDADHNRSVITLAGEPEAVAEAALRGVGRAARADRPHQAFRRASAPWRDRRGAVHSHRRRQPSKTASRWRKKSAAKFGSVITFRFISTKPQRSAPSAPISKISARASSKACSRKSSNNPDRAPDIGEPRLHPTAGAIVVGARKFLVAYNINLNTPDLEIAKKIARTSASRMAGLRYVKAMGVDLRARQLAQVSINMTDFEQTPLHRVFEMVKREAERYGVTIVGSEIVGLIPKRAIEMTADFYLQLEELFAGAGVRKSSRGFAKR